MDRVESECLRGDDDETRHHVGRWSLDRYQDSTSDAVAITSEILRRVCGPPRTGAHRAEQTNGHSGKRGLGGGDPSTNFSMTVYQLWSWTEFRHSGQD